jgi:hypothetical protein
MNGVLLRKLASIGPWRVVHLTGWEPFVAVVQVKAVVLVEKEVNVGLGYVDVLYGLAAARCFMSAFDGSPHMTASAWSHFAVAIVLISFSWIGYHLNRVAEGPRSPTFRAPFLELIQLGADTSLIAMYYVVAAKIGSDPTVHAETRLLFWIMLVYLFWDVLDLGTNHSGTTQTVRSRIIVDAVFVVLFGLVWLVLREWTCTVNHVVMIDVGLVVALFAYRIVQAYTEPAPLLSEPGLV